MACDTRRAGELDLRKETLNAEDAAALGLDGPASMTLLDVVKALRPTVLVGTSGQPGAFTPAVIQQMAASCPRPIILPLSNPTSKAECTPSEALLHSNGRALVATGSPFEPVIFEGKRHVIGQCNNVFVFPGVGLGLLVSEARRATDSIFLAAADAVAEFTHASTTAEPSLFPRVAALRQVSLKVALRVAQAARQEGVGQDVDDAILQQRIESWCWFPQYKPLATATG